MKTYKDLSFERITETDVEELTAIMKRAFDADSMLHLGKPLVAHRKPFSDELVAVKTGL